MKPIAVEAPQRSREWFDARLGKVTGSKVADTMAYYAVTKRHIEDAMFFFEEVANESEKLPQEIIDELAEKYPLELCLRADIKIQESSARKSYRENLVGERLTNMPADPDMYVTYDMRWGIANEPLAKALYQMEQKILVEDAPLFLHPELKCGASPDGLATDMNTGEIGNVEVKCLRSANHLYKIIKEQEVPKEYYPQIQMQMWINGRDWCDFIGFDGRLGEGLKIFVKRVPRDNFFIEYVLEPSVKRFLAECDRDERFFRAKLREMNQ